MDYDVFAIYEKCFETYCELIKFYRYKKDEQKEMLMMVTSLAFHKVYNFYLSGKLKDKAAYQKLEEALKVLQLEKAKIQKEFDEFKKEMNIISDDDQNVDI